MLDGFIARKLNVASDIGAYLDATADFVLIGAAFLAFSRRNWYGVLEFCIILASFIGFMASSKAKRPIYDPVGKYMWTFLMAMIMLTLLLPHPTARKCLTLLLCLFYAISLICRFSYLHREHDSA